MILLVIGVIGIVALGLLYVYGGTLLNRVPRSVQTSNNIPSAHPLANTPSTSPSTANEVEGPNPSSSSQQVMEVQTTTPANINTAQPQASSTNQKTTDSSDLTTQVKELINSIL